MVPNHALIIHSLLHGDDDFQKSLMIVNTCGWDTDCNSGNVGCILGVKNGLAGLETGPDLRGPVADRMYLATADGGRAHHRRGDRERSHRQHRALTRRRSIAGAQRRCSLSFRIAWRRPGVYGGYKPGCTRHCHGRAGCRPQPGRGWQPGNSFPWRCARALRTCARRPSSPRVMKQSILSSAGMLFASPSLYSGQTVRAALSAESTMCGRRPSIFMWQSMRPMTRAACPRSRRRWRRRTTLRWSGRFPQPAGCRSARWY